MLALLILSCTPWVLPPVAQDGDAATPHLEVTRLLVIRPSSLAPPQTPAKNRGGFNTINLEEGILVDLMLALPGKTLVKLDKAASKYTLKDDKGRLLEAAMDFDKKSQFFSPTLSDNRTTLKCTLGSPMPPARGTQQLHIQGHLSLLCATGRETSGIIDLPASKGGRVTVGPINFTLKEFKLDNEFGKSVRLVRLEVGRDGHLIEKLEFVDATGKPLESKQAGWMTFNGIEARDYHVDPNPAKLHLRVTYYPRTEQVKVPLDLKVGIGM